MFKDMNGLIQEIKSGKTNEEIFNERLEYLYSEEYHSQLFARKGNRTVTLINGFIGIYEPIAISDFFEENNYILDDEEALLDLIEFVRQNIDNQLTPAKIFNHIRDVVREYCLEKKQDAKYNEMIRHIKNPREDFAVILNQYLYFQSKGLNISQEEFMQFYISYKKGTLKLDDNEKNRRVIELFSQYEIENQYRLNDLISIRDIKGLGIGECVEIAGLSQNMLSFLGFNSFMLAGMYDDEPHQFNAVEINGKYCLFDASANCSGLMDFIKKPEDLLSFGKKGSYTSCKRNLSEIKELAKKGKDYRINCNKKLIQLQKYNELHGQR